MPNKRVRDHFKFGSFLNRSLTFELPKAHSEYAAMASKLPDWKGSTKVSARIPDRAPNRATKSPEPKGSVSSPKRF